MHKEGKVNQLMCIALGVGLALGLGRAAVAGDNTPSPAKAPAPVALAGAAAAHASETPEPPAFDEVLKNIRPDHPRLFLNADILQRIKDKGLTPRQQGWLAELKRHVDGYPAPPDIDDRLKRRMLGRPGHFAKEARPHGNWEAYAEHAALVYLLTGERKYYDKGVQYLKHVAEAYALIHAAGRVPPGRTYKRTEILSAYDWLYNDLPERERRAIGEALFPAVRACAEYWDERLARVLYHDALTRWYLGLVFLGTGIEGAEDAVCTRMLREQYARALSILDEYAPPPDGTKLWGAIGYTAQLAQGEIRFSDAWRSAIGESFDRYYPHRMNRVEYLLWNTIAPTRDRPFCYGWSDTHHIENLLDRSTVSYLCRAPDLFADAADPVTLDRLTAVAQFQTSTDYFLARCLSATDWPQTAAAPLLMSTREVSGEEIEEALARIPRARYFPHPLGHIFMNSGWGEDDTYCMFVAGRQATRRKHYDENHFTIYKRGFLAIDSGSRGVGLPCMEPGLRSDHISNYYYDTVAHNCVLIRMEGETLPGYWGIEAEGNTGGMNKNFGAQVRAFETNDRYTYIASDATSCYHQDKAQEVVRQFVFVYPDYFVVFDRVVSKQPDQKKTWLLHTQYEPRIQGDTFSADHREGRIFVRTLLPREPELDKVGGPGKEFLADGKNWPVWRPEERPDPDEHLLGQWRTEISPAQENRRELFLHLIQVGDKEDLASMAHSELVEQGEAVGLAFQADGMSVRVVFNRTGSVGGRIRVAAPGREPVDKALAQTVMPQPQARYGWREP